MHNSTKKNKIFRNKLNHLIESLILWNLKTLMKIFKNDTKKWKDIPYSWIGRINIAKMPIVPKSIYRFSVICQNTYDIFHRTRTNNLQICMKTQKTQECQNYLEKEEQSLRCQGPWLHTLWQGYSNQNTMVLAPKQTQISGIG